jgi:hypothetical protein
LRTSAKKRLLDDVVRAVGFAKLGLDELLAGKKTRPAAWTLDIFTRDVCDALRDAGLPVAMHPDPESSLAQSFAQEVADTVGLPGTGKMFKQMQRAKEIKKRRLTWETLYRQDSRARRRSSSVN